MVADRAAHSGRRVRRGTRVRRGKPGCAHRPSAARMARARHDRRPPRPAFHRVHAEPARLRHREGGIRTGDDGTGRRAGGERIVTLVNYQTREITCKVVYYGPGRSGKTTNLHTIFSQVPED